jgi:hypothetical protein
MSAYTLRIPDDLMREAERAAAAGKVSLNQFLLSAIAERVGAERTHRLFAELAKRADPAALQSILDRVPDVPPVPGDEIEES